MVISEIKSIFEYFSIAASSTEAAECESGDVKLANFTDDPAFFPLPRMHITEGSGNQTTSGGTRTHDTLYSRQ